MGFFFIQPSRELADQTLNQLRMFKKYLEQPVVRELLVVGGQSSKDQIGALREGVDIVVATPGSTLCITFIMIHRYVLNFLSLS